jgi:hypothetical protein
MRRLESVVRLDRGGGSFGGRGAGGRRGATIGGGSDWTIGYWSVACACRRFLGSPSHQGKHKPHANPSCLSQVSGSAETFLEASKMIASSSKQAHTLNTNTCLQRVEKAGTLSKPAFTKHPHYSPFSPSG